MSQQDPTCLEKFSQFYTIKCSHIAKKLFLTIRKQ
ncbi:SWIM-type domain-containing protein [Caenorhabditis elegans]|uniref:SWIM-type domain-containing protein n=1 Tax=Caenorhabditis elegans TaxID=6239 RepID=U4PMF0_CAEEL|nr:SWIM-type domain-containing protein [Caenorhabditis elegans]CDH93261.1 SWIM-type domain-containing protein [Caenorhabditis elegans]|eukprot:NP_001294764.1 Uncharacterized protein CELE_C54F6.19 [Caenorhabditis elegans]